MSLTTLQRQADAAFERTRRDALQRGLNAFGSKKSATIAEDQQDVRVQSGTGQTVGPSNKAPDVKPASLPSLQWGPILTWGAVGCAALYLYKTVKDDGVTVNATTGEKRSIFRWIDILLGTLLATYLIRMVFTF